MFPDRDVVTAPAGAAPEVAVWLAGPAARSLFEASAQTPEDFERWQRIVSPARREEWEVSRALLAHVRRNDAKAAGAGGASAGTAESARSSAAHMGEAQLHADYPAYQPRPATALSLSHSGGFAAVAAGRGVLRLGVDLECTRRVRDVMRIAQFAFTDAEVAQLQALSGEARDERFYILWTLKEAFAKALSLELLAGLRRCSFVEERGEWRGDVPAAGDRAWSAWVFRAAPTLVLSVVALLPFAGNCRVFVHEWPGEKSGSWSSLATLRSGLA